MTLPRPLRSRRVRWVALVIVVVLAAAVAAATWPSTKPAPIQAQDQQITVPAGPGLDGTVTLDAGLYLPSTTPAPAVIVAHGFGGSRMSVDGDAQRLARAGFVVLTYSARGFGTSTGMIALDSLDYEVPDARALVDWLSQRPEVLQDASGDPRVGVTGGSYGGALALMLAGTDPRVDAVAAIATWNSLQQALFPNNGALSGPSPQSQPMTPPSPDSDSTDQSAQEGSPDIDTPAAIPPEPDGVFKQRWTAALLTSVLAQGIPAGPSGPGLPASSQSHTTPAPETRPATGAACGNLMPDLCLAYLTVAETGRLTPTMAALLANSSPAQVVGQITAPTLLVQGEQDTLFGLDQADANARAIAANGTPVAVSWYPGGHSGGGLDDRTSQRVTEWLEYYLDAPGVNTESAPPQGFWYFTHGTVTGRDGPTYRGQSLPEYPGLADSDVNVPAFQVDTLRLTGAPQPILHPPGGAPAALTSLFGLANAAGSAVTGALSGTIGGIAALPGQTALFTSDPVEGTAVIVGSPTITLDVSRLPIAPPTGSASTLGATSSAVLYFSLVSGPPPPVEKFASGTVPATWGGLPLGGVAPVRIDNLPANGDAAEVTVHLPAVAHQVAAGDIIGVRVSTTNQAFAGPRTPALYRISLTGGGASKRAGDGGGAAGQSGADGGAASGVLRLPTAEGTRLGNDSGPLGWAIALGLLAIISIGALIVAGRPRRGRPRATNAVIPNDAATSIPLTIAGLQKEYPGGVRAVDGVDLTVERGQVLGLLGPNGAGKTTTLRMVLGLITPTAGDIRLFGEPTGPGAPVLSRIGSFVEGAGFLPHLSGMTNLRLFWQATGRPAGQAYLDEALQIAGLGSAVRRKVKTYSQGMRQRLAIAQAMLGLPDLLILDEPTNGLDPSQIHAMREVIRGYARTGRTVLVSSHLLSEVEQTCTHVVVMAAGRSIASGTVTELVAASGELLITTPDPHAAQRALATLAGMGEMDPVETGLAVDRGSASVNDLMRALILADVTVDAVAPRNRLEEVFLDLVGAGSAASPDAPTDGDDGALGARDREGSAT